MGKILKHYMTLVPTVSAEGKLVLPNGSEEVFDDSRFHSILFGGGQLTVARIRGAQALRDTEDKKTDRFEGLTAIIADWHARMTLLKVSTLSKPSKADNYNRLVKFTSYINVQNL